MNTLLQNLIERGVRQSPDHLAALLKGQSRAAMVWAAGHRFKLARVDRVPLERDMGLAFAAHRTRDYGFALHAHALEGPMLKARRLDEPMSPLHPDSP